MKRNRVDGQLSKSEYEKREIYEENVPNIFSKATPNTLASRRMVTAQRFSKKHEFIKYIKVLNKSLHHWFKEQVQLDSSVDLSAAAQDYIDYATQLEDRFLRKYGEVLTFGSGDCGQLAHGMEKDEDLMVRFPRIVYSLRDKKVCGIACGGLHNAVYTEDGHVYTWGCSDDGSLGRSGDESAPLLVSALSEELVIGVACGDGQTIVLTAAGTVWGWGCYKDKEGNKWFNCGSGETNFNRQQNTPMLLDLPNTVDIKCGSSFNLARCSDGGVYSWGIGECGELGRVVPPLKKPHDQKALSAHLTPSSMMVTEHGVTQQVRDAKTIGCGSYHSMAVLVGKGLYSCGLNNYGQLGAGDADNRTVLTRAIGVDETVPVVAVCGGMHHSLALTAAGGLLAWGRADSGQLGVSGVTKETGGFRCSAVVPVLDSKKQPAPVATAIACGGNHNLCITTNGDVYSWGYGDMLALGHGEERDEETPRKVNFSKAKVSLRATMVAGGGQHSAILGEMVGSS